MKLSDISSLIVLALCSAVSDAAPAPPARKTARDVDVLNMVLFGAAEANYPLTVPLDCTPVYTRKPHLQHLPSSTSNKILQCYLSRAMG